MSDAILSVRHLRVVIPNRPGVLVTYDDIS